MYIRKEQANFKMKYFNLCRGFLFMILTKKIVAAPSYSFTPCEFDEDCAHLDSALCENFTCKCNGTAFCRDRVDIMVTALGKNCWRSRDCNIKHSECADRKCTCKEGFVGSHSGKKCLPVSDGIGGVCEENVQCYTKINSTGCQNNKCVCMQDMHDHEGLCYRTLDLGKQCNHDGECSDTLFAHCENSMCTCTDSFIASRKLSLCLPIATSKGSQCQENIQCTTSLGGGSACINGYCNCNDLYQYKETNKRCVRDMLLGDVCGNHSDCHQPGPGPSRLECIVGICQCQSSYTEIDGYCIETSSSSALKYMSTLLFMSLLYLLL